MVLKRIKDFFLSEPDYIKHSSKRRLPLMEQSVEYRYSPNNKPEFDLPIVSVREKLVDPPVSEFRPPRDEVSSSLVKLNPFEGRKRVNKFAEVLAAKASEDVKNPFVVRDIPSPTHGFLRRKSVAEEIKENQGIGFELNNDEKIIKSDEIDNELQKETMETVEEKYDFVISSEVEEDLMEDERVQTLDEESLDNVNEEELVEETDSISHVPSEEFISVPNPRAETAKTSSDSNVNYMFPALHMLKSPIIKADNDKTWMLQQKDILEKSLNDFHVKAEVVNMQQGPSITRFEVQPAPGVKVNKITNLSDDLKLSLAAKDIRIQAPIPGQSSVGVEIPNRESRPVLLREVLQSKEFKTSNSPLTVALGMDISGQPIVTDLKKMPHGLIAGATGSGKSVCINTMLVSLLYKSSPEDVKLLLIDPKMVELTPYNDLPHLVSPVITDAKAATKALKWAVSEMDDRYQKFVDLRVRDIERYNEKSGEKMPYIVIVIDELADLMMVAPSDVEDSIARIAQKARACGIHLIVATQRPSVDVITGLIKANIPTRIAFAVSSQIDSRTILDEGGAEKLLGKGDMLFAGNGAKPVRLQGNFVSDGEIEEVTGFVKRQQEPDFLFVEEELIENDSSMESEDELFLDAVKLVIEHGSASSSGIQRKFRVGYNRAARLIDIMEEKGIVSAQNGSKPREVLISLEQFNEMI